MAPRIQSTTNSSGRLKLLVGRLDRELVSLEEKNEVTSPSDLLRRL